MGKKLRANVHAAVLAALYLALTHLQNFIFPGSATAVIQCRLSEGLCVLAFFTPAAIPGLTLGCILFNVTSGSALPLDFLAGGLATFLSTWTMWKLRRLAPLGLVFPAIWNGLLVGWELTVYAGGGFWFNAGCVALGETLALVTLGGLLYAAIRNRRLDQRIFREGSGFLPE